MNEIIDRIEKSDLLSDNISETQISGEIQKIIKSMDIKVPSPDMVAESIAFDFIPDYRNEETSVMTA